MENNQNEIIKTFLKVDSPKYEDKSYYSIIRWIDDDSYTADEIELFRKPLKLNKILNEMI